MPRRLVRPLAVVAAVALVLVALVEIGARGLEPHVPAPPSFADASTAVKAAQLDAHAGGCTDVVVVGNSMARDAFDPTWFEAADPAGRRAYNAALDAAAPAQQERWAIDRVVPALAPATVVVAVASLDLNANGPTVTAAGTAYAEADATRGGPARWFVDHSALVRNRRALRDPEVLWSSIDRWRQGEVIDRPDAEGIPGVLGAAGEGVSRRDLRYRGEPGAQAFTRQQLLTGWALDGEQVDALGRLIAGVQASGSTVVVAVLPVTADYVGLHPGGDADMARFLGAVEQVAADHGAAVLDLHDRQPVDAFADTHHLNEAGARWFSAELPGMLDAVGATGRCRA